jgi:hypothetical protein
MVPDSPGSGRYSWTSVNPMGQDDPGRRGHVAPRRLTLALGAALVVLVGCGCSGQPSATPAVAHKATLPAPRPTTTVVPPATSTTTGVLSAVPTTVPVPAPLAPGWSMPLTTLPPGGGFTSVSCISDTFCVASGGGTSGNGNDLTSGSGVAVSWDGAAWSDPSVYYPAPSGAAVTAPLLPAISCTSGPSCVIADGSGHLSEGDGTHWSSPNPIPPAPPLPANPSDPGPSSPDSRSIAVSCPAPSLCGLVDNTGHTYTLRDGSWQASQSFGEPDGPNGSTVSLYQSGRVGISCPSNSSCTAVVGSSVLDWDGSSWAQEPSPWTTSSLPESSDTAISCLPGGQCLIVSGTGMSLRTPGSGWSPLQDIDPRGGLDAVSCATASFCVAADQAGAVVQWNGTAWSAPQQVIPAAGEYPGIGTSVTCPSAQFCMILNSDGDYATYSGPAAR